MVPLIIFLIMLLCKEKIFEGVTSYIDWFKLHPYQGFIYYTLVFFIWFPLMLPPIVLVSTAGWTFAQTFGSVKGYFLCVLATTLGYTPGCLFTFMLGKYCFHDYIQKNVIGKIRIFKAIDKCMVQTPTRMCILLGL